MLRLILSCSNEDSYLEENITTKSAVLTFQPFTETAQEQEQVERQDFVGSSAQLSESHPNLLTELPIRHPMDNETVENMSQNTPFKHHSFASTDVLTQPTQVPSSLAQPQPGYNQQRELNISPQPMAQQAESSVQPPSHNVEPSNFQAEGSRNNGMPQYSTQTQMHHNTQVLTSAHQSVSDGQPVMSTQQASYHGARPRNSMGPTARPASRQSFSEDSGRSMVRSIQPPNSTWLPSHPIDNTLLSYEHSVECGSNPSFGAEAQPVTRQNYHVENCVTPRAPPAAFGPYRYPPPGFIPSYSPRAPDGVTRHQYTPRGQQSHFKFFPVVPLEQNNSRLLMINNFFQVCCFSRFQET